MAFKALKIGVKVFSPDHYKGVKRIENLSNVFFVVKRRKSDRDRSAANKRIIPLASAIDHTDAVNEQETLTAEKCLLYVALTRAQKGAYISGYGQMTDLIKS